MKSFLLTFSIYLLSLSFISCNDLDRNANNSSQMVKAIKQKQQNKQESEACTPFCSCSCCPTSAFYQTVLYLGIKKFELKSEKYCDFNSNFYSEITFSIWQPPKFS